MMYLTAENLSVGYRSKQVLRDVSLSVDPSEIAVIIGPNGSGKSTLLTALSGQISPAGGKVFLQGKSLASWRRRSLARNLAFLPQQPQAPGHIRVRDLVTFGRFAHRGPLSSPSARDHEAVDHALEQTGSTQLADRDFGALSGGERQRVWISLVLAQSPRFLLMDEPTSFLDPGFQYQILDLLKSLVTQQEMGLVMVLHDVNQASLYADRVIALQDGRIAADGSPKDVITPSLVGELFGLNVQVLSSMKTMRPFCVPACVFGAP
ncbi:MAG: ABC transporter ATP-binding protein [Pseudomonadota bacterium]